MPDITTILLNAGPVGVVLLTFGWLYGKQHIATGRELKQVQIELDRERQERAAEKGELRQEITFWREQFWTVARITDKVAGALPPSKEHV